MAPIRIAIMMLLAVEVGEGLLRGRERDWFERRGGGMEGEWNTEMKWGQERGQLGECKRLKIKGKLAR